MTQNEIIEMYMQVSKELSNDTEWCWAGVGEPLQMFANLVAAKATAVEREACAKVCEDGINNAADWDSSAWDQACENRSYAIRARGEA